MFDSWQSERVVHILFDRKQNGENTSLCSTAHFVFTRFFWADASLDTIYARELCSKVECMYKRFYNLARSGFFSLKKFHSTCTLHEAISCSLLTSFRYLVSWTELKMGWHDFWISIYVHTFSNLSCILLNHNYCFFQFQF